MPDEKLAMVDFVDDVTLRSPLPRSAVDYMRTRKQKKMTGDYRGDGILATQ